MGNFAEKVKPKRGSEKERECRDEDADCFRNPRGGLVRRVPGVIAKLRFQPSGISSSRTV
jgi:hypothetical protein